MSLLRDYLGKTTPQARPGQDAQVPPMLRQNNPRGKAKSERRVQIVVVGLVLLFLTGYILKTSFYGSSDASRLQPPALSSIAGAAPGVKPAALPVEAALHMDSDKPFVVPKAQPLPLILETTVTEESVEQTGQTVKINRAGQTGQADAIPQAKATETLQMKEKLQAAMEANKQIEAASEMLETQNHEATEQYSTPSTAGADDFFNLGLAAQKRGALNQALGYYRRVLILEPDHSKALLNLSAMHINTGNFARAMPILKKLRAREPENVDAMVNFGILLLKENNYDGAEFLFEKALDLQGHNTTVLFNLAYLNQVQNRLDRAAQLYTRLFSIDRDNTGALLAMGSIMEKQNNLSRAMVCYVQALDTTAVENSKSLRLKIENRVRVLQQIKADADPKTTHLEGTHD